MFFDGLARPAWYAVPVAKAKEHFDLGEISNDSVDLEDLFGEEPECFFVHRGDVTVEGPLMLGGDENTLHVIDGNLTVNGPVKFRNPQINTSLYVTGSVTADELLCMPDSQLFVGGSLVVRNLLLTYLFDAGHLVVHGPVSVGTWIEAAGRGAIDFSAPPTGRLLGTANHPDDPYFPKGTDAERAENAVRKEFLDDEGYLDTGKVQQAILAGQQVLR